MKKTVKILGVSFASILAILVIIPLLIPDTISKEISKAINKNIKGEVKFESTNISFFTHFPSLTLNLNNFLLKGSAPFAQDTLLHTQKLSLGINVLSLITDQIKVNEFYLDNATINVQVDEQGNANYNVYESADTLKSNEIEEPSNTAIKIDGIYIKNSVLTYNDKSLPMMVKTEGLNYKGTGDLSAEIFDLKSKLSIDELNFYYDGVPYFKDKNVSANLITKVNTNSLDLIFDQNNLLINKLPIEFKGKFSFIKDGYSLDFKTSAKETDLQNIFTALPPDIASKLEKTKMKGFAELNVALVGDYIAKTNTMPSFDFNLKIREGQISNPNAPEPISNLYLNLKTSIPKFNMDSLNLNMDSLYFNIGKDYFASNTKIIGLNSPEIFTKTRSDIDLAKWSSVVNIDELALKGRLKLNINADGKFSKKVEYVGIRQRPDTVIASIPKFNFNASLSNGYFKMAQLPTAIDLINFNLNATNTDGLYKNTKIDLNGINIKALNNYIKGFAKMQTSENNPVEMQLQGLVDFADIKNIYPIEGLDLSGIMTMDLNTSGPYNTAKKLFPITKANFKINNGRIKTSTIDEPLENIQIDADLLNTDGTLKNTKLKVKPIGFELAGQPFELKANVINFDNITYDIQSKGTLDIGKLYKLFAIKGYQVNGIINTNLAFKGTQSDAIAGQIGKLKNKGSLKISDLNLHADAFPKSFIIKNGVFSFYQDKMNFKEFAANYGGSDFKLNGNLSNVVNFVLKDGANLTGNFKLTSSKIVADEFMVFAAEDNNQPLTIQQSSKGVIIIPNNLNVNFAADVQKVIYNGLNISNAKGAMAINNGKLSLSKTGFTIAGAQVEMDANYQSTGTKTALFDFNLNAKEFDIARAYKEIKLFREMASSAKSVKGIVGLDYKVSGKLNDEMFPILPSLTGGGTLTLANVNLMGFKMMNAVSKATERDSLNNPNLKNVEIKTTLKNNILTIEPTRLRIAGFRPRFEGQVSMDGKLNLSGRVGLPPFGLIGIPLSVTGTQENPIIKLKRNKDGKLEETSDDSDN